MTKNELIKALDGDSDYHDIFVDYLKSVIDEFFEKYTNKYPLLKQERKYAFGDAGSYVIDILKKLFYHIERSKILLNL